MNLIRCLHITNAREAIHEMGKVEVDATGIKLMKGKILHFNFRIERIDPRTANLFKQEMLAVGGDAALDR
jgi:dihydropteroate synthase